MLPVSDVPVIMPRHDFPSDSSQASSDLTLREDNVAGNRLCTYQTKRSPLPRYASHVTLLAAADLRPADTVSRRTELRWHGAHQATLSYITMR